MMRRPRVAWLLVLTTVLVLLAQGSGIDAAPPLDAPDAEVSGDAAPEQSPAPEVAEPEADLFVGGRILRPDGEPASGATVRVLPDDGTPEEPTSRKRRNRQPVERPSTATVVQSGEDGTFKATQLEGETFRIRVEADGFAPFHRRAVAAGQTVDVELEPGRSLSGWLLDQHSAAPIAGGTIRACDDDAVAFGHEACRRGQSGDAGEFRLDGLTAGLHRVLLYSAAHARKTLPSLVVPQLLDPESEEPRPIEEYLGPGGRVTGRVLDSAGQPVAGAVISFRPVELDMRSFARLRNLPSVEVDEHGAFDVQGLPADRRYRVQAAADGYTITKQGPYLIEPGTHVADLELQMQIGATLQFRLLDSEERPVSDFNVQLVPVEPTGDLPTGRRFGQAVYIDQDKIDESEDGNYRLPHLSEGLFDVLIVPKEYQAISVDKMPLRNAEISDLGTLTVEPGRTVFGRVIDSDEEPIPLAGVRASWRVDRRPTQRSAKTDEEGRFRLGGLSDGTVARITVNADGFLRLTRSEQALDEDELEFVLERGAIVTGRVTLPDGSIPQLFQIRTHDEANQESGPANRFRRLMNDGDNPVFSDPEGRFSVEDLQPGTVTLEATAKGFAAGRKSGVELASGDRIDVGTITLREGLTLRGRVIDATHDTPIPGASVTVSVPELFEIRALRQGEPTWSAQADRDGQFSIQGLEPGSAQARAEHPDYSPAEVRVELHEEAAPEELVLELGQGGTLTGTVYGSAGAPVAESRVSLFEGVGTVLPRMATTDERGEYRFERLIPGSYSVSGSGGRSAGGFNLKTAIIEEGQVTVVDFGDEPSIRLSGRVLRGTEAVPGVGLTFILNAGGAMLMSAMEVKSARSDGDGRYELGLDRPGAYRVMVNLRGGQARNSAGVELVVPDEPEVSRDIVLGQGRITGRVTDARGEPLARAYVTARDANSGPNDFMGQHGGATSDSGAYSIRGIAPGSYTVTASATGYTSVQREAITVTEESETVDFELERGRLLRGRVVDPDGNLVRGAMIFVADSGRAASFSGSSETDINGVFELAAPVDGPVNLTAVAMGWAPGRVEGIVPDDDGQETMIRLSRGGSVEITVTGADGEPAAGVAVVARPLEEYPGSYLISAFQQPRPSDSSGNITIGSLAPGRYELVVVGHDDIPPVQVDISESAASTARFSVPRGP